MGSGSHRSHILDSRYNQIGVGTVWSGGRLYVTEIFVRRGSVSRPTVVRRSAPTVRRRYAVAPRKRPKPKPRPVVVAAPPPPPALAVDFLLQFAAMDAADVARLDLLAVGPSLRAR